ncbi:TOMM precursor leader peptide-binding protein, partial [Streptomonospora algeriensis]
MRTEPTAPSFAAPVAAAAGEPPSAQESGNPTVSRLRGLTAGSFCLRTGWDAAWESEQWQRARAAGREHLSVRLSAGEALIGPLWAPGTDSGCSGCAELRERTVLEHPLAGDLANARGRPTAPGPLLHELLDAASRLLAQ